MCGDQRQLAGVGSLLSHGFGLQAWWQVSLPSEPSYQPYEVLEMHCVKQFKGAVLLKIILEPIIKQRVYCGKIGTTTYKKEKNVEAKSIGKDF